MSSTRNYLTDQPELGCLANLLTWGGVALLLVGGLLIYPALQPYIARPPDPPAHAFTVTPVPATLLAPQAADDPAADDLPALLPSFEEATPTPEAPTPGVPTSAPPPEPASPTATSPPPTAQPRADGTQPPSPPAIPPPTQLPSQPTRQPTRQPTNQPTNYGPPTRLVIPAIALDTPIVPVGWEKTTVDGIPATVLQIPANAAGWDKTSALAGQPGNTVLNGHNATRGEVFRYLENLRPGDEVLLYAGEALFLYHVAQVLLLPEAGQPLEVRTQNARHILPTSDTRLTLVTCWPYYGLSHRLIVIAFPAGQPQGLPLPGGAETE